MAKTGEKSKEEAKKALMPTKHVCEKCGHDHDRRDVPDQGWPAAQDDVLSQEVLRLT